jgi:zinc protease
VSAEELRFAKRFLTNSHAFDIDTASKRLDGRVDAELFGIDPRELTRVPARVRKVSRPAVAEALRRRIYPNHALVSLVGPAKELEPAFAALPGVTQTQVIHYKKI